MFHACKVALFALQRRNMTRSMSSRASDRDLNSVTVIADTRFEFPGADFYGEISDDGLGMGREFGQRLEKIYRYMLQLLALPLTPHGSHGLIEKQIHEICGRFPRYKDGMRGLALDERADRAAEGETGAAAGDPTASLDSTLFGRLTSLGLSGAGSAGYLMEISEEDLSDGYLADIMKERISRTTSDSQSSRRNADTVSEYF